MNFDFKEFQNTKAINPPDALSSKILDQVKRDLHPSAFKVFSKLSIIHFLVGVATLAICPQFGLKLFGDDLGLMSVFMHFGHYGCMMACGFFFLGSSVCVASLILKPEELRVIRANRLAQFLSLALLSLGFFIMVDTEILALYAFLWLIGSLCGALTMTEVVWAFRIKPSCA